MKIESKKLLNLISKLAVTMPVLFFILATSTQAQSFSIFNNTLKTRVIPNCSQRAEFNQFTNQVTYNEVCNPTIYDYNTGSNSNQQMPVQNYSYPTQNYYQPTISYSAPSSYVNTVPQYIMYNVNNMYDSWNNTPSALSYYTGSNIWYPQNNYGYSDSRMFGAYYGGPEGAGYYDRYYDSPYLCFDGGPNCGGYPREEDYYNTAQRYGQANGLSPYEVDELYDYGYDYGMSEYGGEQYAYEY